MSYPGYVIRSGSAGSFVTELQTQLNVKLNGDPVLPVPVVIDSVFGPGTLAAVQRFQTVKGLTVDGVVGPRTWNMLFMSGLADLANLRLAALQNITAELNKGIHEIPPASNSGPGINDYLASVSAAAGDPWCQALVYWCYQEAVLQMNTSAGLNLANPVIRTAGVMENWNATDSKYQITAAAAAATPALILPGYQMILDEGGGSGHTGLVNNMNGTTIITIEGNSNLNGSTDGEEIVRQTTARTLSSPTLLGFIIY